MEAALVKKYEEMLASDPSSRIFSQLGELYRKLGMIDKALNLYREGIKKHPSYILGYMGLAFCYFDLEQYQLAYATLRPIVENSRDNIRMQKLFAECCEKLNYKEEALTTWKYLLFINPKDAQYSAHVTALETESSDNTQDEKYPQSFAVDKIQASPIDDVDDWIRMDLSGSNSDSSTNSKVKEILPVRTDKESVDTAVEESPLMSLTLVDLYIAQGHIDKAKEVLIKMAELNPSDKRIDNRLHEIEENSESYDNDEGSEEDAHSKLLKMVEEKQSIFIEDGESQSISINLLDKFLVQIKQRAEEKNSQS